MFSSAFVEPKSVLSGDNLIHSLPFHYLLSDFASDGEWCFWRFDLGFGYPAYADGQAGFFHPWLLTLFGGFGTLAAHDLVYASSFAITGVVAFCIARTLGLSPIAASLAAIFAAFSPTVLWNIYNAAYAHALAWCTVMLLAFERWEHRRSAASVVVFGIATALALLAGYPPLVYANAVFLGFTLLVRMIQMPRDVSSLGFGFAIAIAIGAGLAALQLLPLVELASASSRGTLAPQQNYSFVSFLVGLFMVNDPDLYREAVPYFLAPLGTALAVLGAGCAPFVRDRFASSYLLASVLCLSAAAGMGSPGYELLHALVPGFGRLRSLSPFLMVAVVPLAILLATAFEAALHDAVTPGRAVMGAICLVLALLLVLLAQPTQFATANYLVVSVLAVSSSAVALLIGRLTKRPGAPLAALACIALVEVWMIRGNYLRFFPDDILAESRPLVDFLSQRLHDEPGARVAHLWRGPTREQHDLLVYSHWKSDGYEGVLRADAARLIPNRNIEVAIPILRASEALPIAGMTELREVVTNELAGRGSAPGRRAIDRLGIRYVIADVTVPPQRVASGLQEVWRDPTGRIAILENANASRAVRSLADGAAALIIEPAPDGDVTSLPSTLEPSVPQAVATVLEALPWVEPERAGPVKIDSRRAVPVFMPMIAYPGWSAWIDGNRVPLRPDSRFGMWMDVPQGRHHVELRFIPHSFHLGVLISTTTFAAVTAWAVRWTMHRSRR